MHDTHSNIHKYLKKKKSCPLKHEILHPKFFYKDNSNAEYSTRKVFKIFEHVSYNDMKREGGGIGV